MGFLHIFTRKYRKLTRRNIAKNKFKNKNKTGVTINDKMAYFSAIHFCLNIQFVKL